MEYDERDCVQIVGDKKLYDKYGQCSWCNEPAIAGDFSKGDRVISLCEEDGLEAIEDGFIQGNEALNDKLIGEE